MIPPSDIRTTCGSEAFIRRGWHQCLPSPPKAIASVCQVEANHKTHAKEKNPVSPRGPRVLVCLLIILFESCSEESRRQFELFTSRVQYRHSSICIGTACEVIVARAFADAFPACRDVAGDGGCSSHVWGCDCSASSLGFVKCC